ncbi:hypothetical protein HRbin36_00039 [bacterium HR36]|nr:hypothetical protein HRbin36_00039 [bacterium HR36]
MRDTLTRRHWWWNYSLHAVHLMGLSLWLGTLVFFPFCVALPVIGGMKALAARPDNWLHLQSENEGIRLAGEFLDIVFQRYFLFQLGCGLAAVCPALFWWPAGRVHRVRLIVLLLALVLVVVNEWGLAEQVRYWRQERYASTPAKAAIDNAGARPTPPDQLAHSAQAEAAFQFWHNWSLAADMAVLILVFIALLLAPAVPNFNGRSQHDQGGGTA